MCKLTGVNHDVNEELVPPTTESEVNNEERDREFEDFLGTLTGEEVTPRYISGTGKTLWGLTVHTVPVLTDFNEVYQGLFVWGFTFRKAWLSFKLLWGYAPALLFLLALSGVYAYAGETILVHGVSYTFSERNPPKQFHDSDHGSKRKKGSKKVAPVETLCDPNPSWTPPPCTEDVPCVMTAPPCTGPPK